MNKEYRECNKDNCELINEIGYHTYKNGTKHIAMICPVHKYTCLPFEELELRDFLEVKKEYYIMKSKFYKANKMKKKENQANKQLKRIEISRKGLSAKELLSL